MRLNAMSYVSGHSQTESGWLGHSSVPRTGSPSPVMNMPMVEAPVHDRMRNSESPMTVMDGFMGKGVGAVACENGMMGNSEASSRLMML